MVVVRRSEVLVQPDRAAVPAATPASTVPAATPAAAVPTTVPAAAVPAATPPAATAPPGTAPVPPGTPPARTPAAAPPLVALTVVVVVPAVRTVVPPPPAPVPPDGPVPAPLLGHVGTRPLRRGHVLRGLLSVGPRRLAGRDGVTGRGVGVLLHGGCRGGSYDIRCGCGCRCGRACQRQRVWDSECEGGDSGSCPHDHSFLFGRGWACIYRPNSATNAPFG